MKTDFHRRLHLWLLLLWTVIGVGLRFVNLTAKPLWTDEFSTIVFSLGHSFLEVPLNQAITTDTLLQPLKPSADTPITAVVQSLFRESNHPPLYFMLSHLWLKLFPATASGLVSTWSIRALPAICGAFSIPLTFLLGWTAFRSQLVAQTAAAFMAVSPFGIYLAQEARHYTLPILWIILSLCCLVVAARRLRDRIILPIWLCLSWILVNAIGIATHYFFVFTLGAEAIVLLSLGLVQSWREGGIWHSSAHWWRAWLVAAGTLASALVWWPVLQNIQESELTRWIYQGERSGWAWLDPIGQAVAGWVTMLYLFPVQSSSQAVVIASGIALVLLTFWTLPKLYRGLKVQQLEREPRLGVLVFSTFVISAILIFFSVTYLFDANLTGAFRYNFVYFPGVVVLIGAGLASSWDVAVRIAQAPLNKLHPAFLNLLRVSNRKTVVLIWLLSLVGAVTVLTNLGYQKTHRPDLVAASIQQDSQNPVLVAIPHRSHGQTGRLMGVALVLQQNQDAATNTALSAAEPQFLLAHQTQDPRSVTLALRQAMNSLPRPLDLWLINFHEVPEQSLEPLLEQQNCEAETRTQSIDGYRYRLYRCTSRPTPRPNRPNRRNQSDEEEPDR